MTFMMFIVIKLLENRIFMCKFVPLEAELFYLRLCSDIISPEGLGTFIFVIMFIQLKLCTNVSL